MTDILALTNSGSSGLYTYRYVGSGIQRRTDLAGGVENNRINFFTYGVSTPDTALPPSGTGSYAVAVSGVEVADQGLLDFSGSGLLQLDFSRRLLTGSGVRTTRFPNPNGFFTLDQQKFTIDGQLGSGSNAFSAILDLGAGFTSIASNGKLYGPAAEEIGLTFYGYNARNQMIAGNVIGRTGAAALPYETLSMLQTPVSLQYYSANIDYVPNSTGGTFSSVASSGVAQGEFLITPQPSAFRIYEDLNESNRVAAQSDARFTTYRPDPTRTYRIYNAGTGNDELVLTYTSFGQREVSAPGSRRIDEAFLFGLQTPFTLIPRSGTGSYSGVLYGSAVGSGNSADRFSLHGSAGFAFDFTAGTFTGSLSPKATNLRTSVVTDLGAYSLVNGLVPPLGQMSGVLNADIAGPAGTTGRLFALFFGPQAQEVGGIFSLTTPGAGTILTATGAVVAARQ